LPIFHKVGLAVEGKVEDGVGVGIGGRAGVGIEGKTGTGVAWGESAPAVMKRSTKGRRP